MAACFASRFSSKCNAFQCTPRTIVGANCQEVQFHCSGALAVLQRLATTVAVNLAFSAWGGISLNLACVYCAPTLCPFSPTSWNYCREPRGQLISRTRSGYTPYSACPHMKILDLNPITPELNVQILCDESSLIALLIPCLPKKSSKIHTHFAVTAVCPKCKWPFFGHSRA
jgi:hypothetical protein